MKVTKLLFQPNKIKKIAIKQFTSKQIQNTQNNLKKTSHFYSDVITNLPSLTNS